MKILVLAEDYPSDKNIYTQAYIHTRNRVYQEEGIDVYVVSFKAKENYIFENVKVFTKQIFLRSNKDIDLVISHAPNFKNHFRILFFSKLKRKKIVFFFHGHEIMDVLKYYPKPYFFQKKKFFKDLFRRIYDIIKLKIISLILRKLTNENKAVLIFVSKWMRETAFLAMRFKQKQIEKIESKTYIINNGVSEFFLNRSYEPENKSEADFVTIRPFDNSKYAIDIVYNIARNNPEYKFHIYGDGVFFDYYEDLDNLKVFKKFLRQKDIPSYLNKYKYALMPTRLDAQGVMMCEIATFNMPLITSDIPICREMLMDFKNVSFIPNTLDRFSLKGFLPLFTENEKQYKFDNKKLVAQEIDVFKEVMIS